MGVELGLGGEADRWWPLAMPWNCSPLGVTDLMDTLGTVFKYSCAKCCAREAWERQSCPGGQGGTAVQGAKG